ncbi:hypothetical protein BB561_004027 [Smittium simulii]|uniref:type I protein arginine methyltransferase n=1 Tax=Smittium simulii TaxID=133385 RepID=A0A2T9YIF8_9FUNG|nr:hypothetical protein BB561_004027 [Smittium simulii]
MDIDANDNSSTNDPTYFSYYAHLQHQQNMLQDFVRTSTYKSAITQLSTYSISGKLVMDVGAGSGILSFFAVQNGATKVYAIEASNMAAKMQLFLDFAKNNPTSKNAFLADKIQIIKAKVEEINDFIPQVDTIISEPIGVLLLHERMLESYIYARDKYLKPNGTMCPSMGTICLAPVTDSYLWAETMTKARFWQQNDYYDIDLSPLAEEATKEYFTSPVVGCFNPNSIMCNEKSVTRHNVDFYTIKLKDMLTIEIPVEWEIKYTGIIHAIGGWFDCEFNLPAARRDEISSNNPQTDLKNQDKFGFNNNLSCLPITLSTSPAHTPTHWQQVRFLLPEPTAVNYGQKIFGLVTLTANEHRSYDIKFDYSISNGLSKAFDFPSTNSSTFIDSPPKKSALWYLNEQVYNYSYNSDMALDSKPESLGLYS